jgi:uncharacterized protein YaaQ
MKLITAIVRDTDNDNITHALTAAGFRVTTIASTGGFLRRGQSTMLIGVDDDQVDAALNLIRDTCTKRSEADPRNSILFVLDVHDHKRF